VIQSRSRTKLALAAIVSKSETPEAHLVAARAGYYELFPGVIYRSEDYMSIAVSTARAIIKQAIADEVHDGDMPEDDATAISKAEELVEMAEQAWASNVRGPEVEKILKLAAADANGDAPAEPEPEAEAEPEPEPSGMEEAASEVVKADGEDEISAPAFFSNLDSSLEKIEPYEAYGEDRVKDVTDALNWYLTDPAAEQTEAQQRELLQNVWAFETSHKNRTRILNFLIEAATQKGFISEEEIQAAESDSEPEAESSRADEGEESEGYDPDAEEADSDSGIEQGEAPSAEDQGGEPDAGTDSGSEAGESSSQGSADESKSPEDFGAAYRKLAAAVDEELQRERVDIPKPPQDDPPELPWRWAEISDQDLQDFHMQYASLAYYKSYRRSREDRIAFHCKEAADQIARALMVDLPKDKDFKVTVAEATIESDSRVKKWRKLQKRHEQMAHQARQEMESYYKLVEALSRLESMRHNAFERGRR
jgi:hypothetical protein